MLPDIKYNFVFIVKSYTISLKYYLYIINSITNVAICVLNDIKKKQQLYSLYLRDY